VEYQSLKIEMRDNGRANLTLSRPDLMNRVDDESRSELIAALTELGRDARTRSIVLAAEGKVFSAGGDFDMMRRKNGDRVAVQRGTEDSRRLVETLNDVRVPLIAAVHGHAFGVGSTVVLSCDIVVASRGVRLADSHVKVGLVAGDGGVVVWPANMGLIKAKRHLLTGDPLLAEDAYQFGIISDLVESPEDVLPTAEKIADTIAALPPLAVQGTKKSFNQAARLRTSEVLELSGQYELETMHSADLIEAIDAFEQKRPGVYRGQ
jgi:enoyl-CoA hydratase/carnithine racemase